MLITTAGTGFANPQPIVIAVQLEDANGKSIRSSMEILGSERMIQIMSDMGLRMKVLVPEMSGNSLMDSEVAYLIPSTGTSSLDLTPVFGLMAKNGAALEDSKYAQLSTVLKTKQGVDLSSDDLKALHKAYQDHQNYVKGETQIVVKVPTLFFADTGRTLSSVKRYNARQGPKFEYLTEELNVTNKMRTEEDIFFIQIPSLENLRSEDIPMSSLIPSPEDVFQPYPHGIYGSTLALRFLHAGYAQQHAILEDYAKRTGDQEQNVPKIPEEIVTGSEENNDLPIQPNEQGFYKALEEFIKYDISQLGDKVDVDKLFNEGVCSSQMLEYLQEVVGKFAAYNYMHTRNFPVLSEDQYADYEEKMSNEETESKMDLGSLTDSDYYDQEDPQNIISGPIYLNSYIQDAVIKVGLRAYIEAIIKLSRWGRRKPTALVIEGVPNYLDMATMLTRNSLGSREDLTPVEVNGYLLEYNGVLGFEEKVKDKALMSSLGMKNQWINIPIGIETIRHYSGGTRQTYYITLPELVILYKFKEVNAIYGISYEKGKFVVDPSVVTDPMPVAQYTDFYPKLQSSSNNLHVAHTGADLKQLCVEYASESFSGLEVVIEHLLAEDALTNRIPEMSFGSKEELVERMKVLPLPVGRYVRINVASLLIGTLIKTAKYCEEHSIHSLEGVLNACALVMELAGIISERSFLDGERALGKEVVPAKAPSPMAESASFTQKQEPVSAPVQAAQPVKEEPMELVLDDKTFEQTLISALIKPMDPNKTVAVIKDSTGKAAAGFYQEKINGKTFTRICGATDLASIPQSNLTESATPFEGVMFFMFGAFHKLMLGKTDEVNVSFTSVQVFLDFQTYMRSEISNKKV